MIALNVKWDSLVTNFMDIYESQDQSNRIQLDYVDMSLDPLQDKWKHIIIIDSMLCICFKAHSCDYQRSKNLLNSYSIFRDCVMTACAASLVRLELH